MARAHLSHTLNADTRQSKNRHRVCWAVGTQLSQRLAEIEIKAFERQQTIYLKDLFFHSSEQRLRGLVQFAAERIQLVQPQRETGGRQVATKSHQMVRAAAEESDKIEPGETAGAASSLLAVKGHYSGGPAKGIHQARRYDSNNPGVPIISGDEQTRKALVRLNARLLERLLEDPGLDLLALVVQCLALPSM